MANQGIILISYIGFRKITGLCYYINMTLNGVISQFIYNSSKLFAQICKDILCDMWLTMLVLSPMELISTWLEFILKPRQIHIRLQKSPPSMWLTTFSIVVPHSGRDILALNLEQKCTYHLLTYVHFTLSRSVACSFIRLIILCAG